MKFVLSSELSPPGFTVITLGISTVQRNLGERAEREARRKAMRDRFVRRAESAANKYRAKLIELYGKEKGKKIRYAEAFELCEYGSRASPDKLKKLFPFFGR